MNEARLILIDSWDVVLYDFTVKNPPKQKGRRLSNDTDDSEDEEAAECKRFKWDLPPLPVYR